MSGLKGTGRAGQPQATERKARSESEAKHSAPRVPVAVEVERLRLQLVLMKFRMPGDLSELTQEEASDLLRAIDEQPGFSRISKLTLIDQVKKGMARRDERQRDAEGFEFTLPSWPKYPGYSYQRDSSGGPTVREVGVRDAQWAMLDMMGTVYGFASELNPYLDLEGRLTPEDLPYGKWLRLESVAALIRDAGDERILSLERDVAALRSAAAVPAPAGPVRDERLMALEAEVAAMVESGKAPELYSERADRKEKPHEFLKRVYGRYLEKGREALYLFQLRKIDGKFALSLAKECSNEGTDIGTLIPKKSQKTDRELGSVPDVESFSRAVLAHRKRLEKSRK